MVLHSGLNLGRSNLLSKILRIQPGPTHLVGARASAGSKVAGT